MSHCILANTSHDQGVSIRSSTGSTLSTNHATTTANIFNNESLLKDFGELIRRNTSHDIRSSTSREWNNNLHRFIWVVCLGKCDRSGSGKHASAYQRPKKGHKYGHQVISIVLLNIRLEFEG